MITHLACQMDGNRRWAQKRGMQSFLGHKEGTEAVKKVIKFCLDKGIRYLSLYTFSLENFKRSEQEKRYLFNLIAESFQKQDIMNEFIQNGVRIQFVGDRTQFPASIVSICEQVEKETAHLASLQVNFLFCYGSRQEILHSVKEIARKVVEGTLALEDISEKEFQNNLWTRDIPEPDIIVRPGNVVRLSNFLLYQSAYSEYYFLDCMWPDITEQHLENVLVDFQQRQRRFGG